jgi:hypothetical protein
MSEENKNEVIEDAEEITEEGPGTAYAMVSFFSFVMLIASLITGNQAAVKYSLLWMCAVRSYGLIFKGIKAEWVAIILYGSAFLYYATQVSPGL